MKYHRLTIIPLLTTLFTSVPAQPKPALDWEAVGDEAVQLFQQYLSIDTSNPPGDVAEAARFYEQVFRSAGIPVQLHWTDRAQGRVNVVARLSGNGAERPLMLLNHMDTVPVDREGWSVDPFSGVSQGGSIYGRGALDMKNFGIAQLMTMLLLKRSNAELQRDVVFVAVADEETTGALGAGWVSENLWPEIQAEYVLDEGGFGTQGFFTNDDQLIFSVGVAEKKVLWLRLLVEGSEGHGSMPPAENANFILSQALARVADWETPTQITPVVAEMVERLGPLEETLYNNALQRNTVSLTVLKGYVGDPPKSNVIPGRAEAVLDCRLLPEQDPDQFVKQLQMVIADPRVRLEFIERPAESIVSPFDTPLFRVMETEIAKVFPQAVVLPHLIIYGTDSRFFRPLGAICYGFFPGPVTIEEYRKIHGNDESIRQSSLKTAVQLYYNVVRSFCSVPGS